MQRGCIHFQIAIPTQRCCQRLCFIHLERVVVDPQMLLVRIWTCRYRAPWLHNDGTQGPQTLRIHRVPANNVHLEVIAQLKLQNQECDESAGNTAEFKRPWDVIKWSPNKNEAPRYGGSCICKYCLERCEEQERASERPLCHGDYSGQLVEKSRKTKRIGEVLVCQRACSA